MIHPQYQNYTAQSFLANNKQLGEQIKAVRELIIGKGLVNMYSEDIKFYEMLHKIENSIKENEIKDTFQKSKIAADLAQESLRYYRRYQTNRYLFCLLIMWLCWIVFLFINISSKPRYANETVMRFWLVGSNIAFIVLMIPLIIEYASKLCL